MRQEQDFPMGQFLGEERKQEKAAEDRGVFYEEDGEVYWHILDPSTGRPAKSGLESVTIIGQDGLKCDGLSTALFVMGLDKAIDFWQQRGRDFDFVIITKDRGLVYSTSLEKSISLLFDFDSVRLVE